MKKVVISQIVLKGSMFVMMSMFFFLTSCATIIGGGPKEKHQRSADIRWGYFIADILTTGGLGLIIDFATGSIYQSKYDKTSSLENELKLAIKNGQQGYLVKDNAYYKAKIENGNVIYTQINKEGIPLSVRKSIEKEIAKRTEKNNIN